MRRRRGGAACGVAALDAQAGEPRSHDGGFFMRLAPGIGYTSSRSTVGSARWKLRGPSGSFDIALGAVIKHNFAIHGTLGGWRLYEPDIELGGIEEDATTSR